MVGPVSILSIGATVVLLVMLSYALILLQRSFEGEAQKAPTPYQGADAAPKPLQLVKRPGPPATINVSPYTGKKDYFAASGEALEAHQTLIDRGGLERIGDFTIAEMPGYVIRAFTHPERNLVGIIYRDPSGKTWLNLQTEYSDGRLITTSSMEKTVLTQSRPHGMPIYNFPATSPEQLLRRHKLETRGVEQAPPLTPENFAVKFAANYARLQERPAGVGEGMELDKSAEVQVKPVEAEMEELVEEPVFSPEAQEPEDFTPTMDQMKKWLALIYSKVNVPKDQRESFRQGLVWIEENASRDAVIQIVEEYAGVTMEMVPGQRIVIRSQAGAEDIVDTEGLSGLALFERLNSHLPEGRRFTRLPVVVDNIAFFSRLAPGSLRSAGIRR
ncbi:MAG: hypothetical protein OEV92_11095 [Nitrospinota bacterium]|nr:hypothetical protein [Nitrospinota bacterium]